MRAELWKKIDELFDAAKKQSADERAAFLDRACRGDGELRAEVESLLRAAGKAETFLEHSPAAALEEQPSLKRGDKLGVFEIVERIGRGGMGAVYRAYDTRLRRQVALKVLPPEHLTDPESKQRLLHEARAASALNYPNIVTVHEIGSEGGVDFIAMELVEGKSLTELIPAKGLPLKKALDYAVQIAGGLAKAHAAGIIHRDLKPGNIMVTPDGMVKLLDFGLARRVQREGTETSSLTVEGEIAGTPAYMSPEQARGEDVDARTDLFSFGVVLYEMATGHPAFSGTTSAVIFDAILHKAPTAPVRLNPDVPPKLEEIINKALEKDCKLRYQTAADLRADLQRLKRDWESGQSDAMAPVSPSPDATAARDRRYSRRWRLVASGGALLAVAVVALAVAAWFWFRSSHMTAPEAPLTAIPLTSYPGFASYPSFSPDGSQVAFTWNGEKQDNFDIYVKVVGSELPLRLTTNPAADTCPAWSPDGRWIAFDRLLPGGKAAVILISPLGGPERILTELDLNYTRSVTTGPFLAWSPDSRWLAIVGNDKPVEGCRLFLYSVETGEKRRLPSPPIASLQEDSGPALSPDGRTLAFVRWASFGSSDLYLLDLSHDFKPVGEPKRLTFGNWVAYSPTWTADGRSLVFSASGNLWRVDASGAGKPQPLALLGANGEFPAISRRGNRLAFVQPRFNEPGGYARAIIWRIDIPTPGGKADPPRKTIASARGDGAPQFSPDGKRIAFFSTRSGSGEIWICDADGSNVVQLTFLGGDKISSLARWSPDSRHLALAANAEGSRAIYVVNASGGSPQRMTSTHIDSANPSWSKDGRWILFDSTTKTTSGIYKVPAEGGPAVLVTNKGGWAPRESPDGKFIYSTGRSGDEHTLLRTPVQGGATQQVLDSIADPGLLYDVVEDGIYFIPSPDPKSGYSIQFLNTKTGKIQRIASLGKLWTGGLTVSPDRRSILYSQADREGEANLMLVENFH